VTRQSCPLCWDGRSPGNSWDRGAQGTPTTLQSHSWDLDHRHHLWLGAFPGGEALLPPLFLSASLFHPNTSGSGKHGQATGWRMTPQSPSWRLYLLGTDECCSDHRDAKQLQGNENWHRSIFNSCHPSQQAPAQTRKPQAEWFLLSVAMPGAAPTRQGGCLLLAL